MSSPVGSSPSPPRMRLERLAAMLAVTLPLACMLPLWANQLVVHRAPLSTANLAPPQLLVQVVSTSSTLQPWVESMPPISGMDLALGVDPTPLPHPTIGRALRSIVPSADLILALTSHCPAGAAPPQLNPSDHPDVLLLCLPVPSDPPHWSPALLHPLSTFLTSHAFQLATTATSTLPPAPTLRVSFTLIVPASFPPVFWHFAPLREAWVDPLTEALTIGNPAAVAGGLYSAVHVESHVVREADEEVQDCSTPPDPHGWRLVDQEGVTPGGGRLIHLVVVVHSCPEGAPLSAPTLGALDVADWGGVTFIRLPTPGGWLQHEELRNPFAQLLGVLRRQVGVSEGGVVTIDAIQDLQRLRRRAAIHQGVHAFQALHDVLAEQSNMVVTKHLAETANYGEHLLRLAAQAEGGWELHQTHAMALEGNAAMQKAFFDEGTLGLLYFPQEHKVAVLAPYFVPVLVPVMVSAVQHVRIYRRSRGRPAT